MIILTKADMEKVMTMKETIGAEFEHETHVRSKMPKR
jgi:hypothetical protein